MHETINQQHWLQDKKITNSGLLSHSRCPGILLTQCNFISLSARRSRPHSKTANYAWCASKAHQTFPTSTTNGRKILSSSLYQSINFNLNLTRRSCRWETREENNKTAGRWRDTARGERKNKFQWVERWDIYDDTRTTSSSHPRYWLLSNVSLLLLTERKWWAYVAFHNLSKIAAVGGRNLPNSFCS